MNTRFFRRFRLLKFFLPYKFHFFFLIFAGMLFGTVNSSIAAMTGFFVNLFSRDTPEQNPLGAMLAQYADIPLVHWFLTNYGGYFTRTDLFYIGVAIFTVLIISMSALVYVEGYLGSWLGARVGTDMSQMMVKKTLSLDMAFFKKIQMSDLLARMGGDLAAVKSSLFIIPVLLSRPFIVACCVAYVVTINWKLTLWALIGMPIATVLMRKVLKKVRRTTMMSIKAGINAGQATLQFINGISTVKAFSCEEFEYENFRRLNEESFRATTKNARSVCAERPLTSIFSKVGVLIVFIISGRMIMAETLAPADLMAFLIALSFMYGPAKEISRGMVSLNTTTPSYERVMEILDLENEVVDGKLPLTEFNRDIEFSHINFAYQQDHQVIHNFSLRIAKGKRVALVGVSGSGKTTIMNLLLRLYDVDGGEIRLDGVNIMEYVGRDLRGQMSLVSQNPFLFTSSIRNNITYGQTEVSPEALEQAARAANLHDEIMALPDGYETILGERGETLSGGQRQRLCIARALYKNAPILLLDEATSALDSENEARVQIAIEALMEGRTSITIAHRLATVKNSDEIIVMDQGRIIGRGPHEELIGTCPTYARMVELQSL